MAKPRNTYEPKFIPSSRLQEVIEYNKKLAISGKRNLYTADSTQLVYHWTDKANGCLPQSGEWSAPKEQSYSLGDHACRVDVGIDFPKYEEVPSHVNGYEPTPENWAADYAFLLDNSPAEIHPFESIVGEFHWEMNEIRKYNFGDAVHELGREVRQLGAGGTSHGHTCLDLGIGIEQGWGGILKRINDSLELYTRLKHPVKIGYLTGLKMVCESIIRYIKKYSETAKELANNATTNEQRKRYEFVANDCAAIAENPPTTYHQGVQWILFAIITDRIVGHGNGYGRIDQYLNDLLVKDIENLLIYILVSLYWRQLVSACSEESRRCSLEQRKILRAGDIVFDINYILLQKSLDAMMHTIDPSYSCLP